MGDRCYMSFKVHPEDTEKFAEMVLYEKYTPALEQESDRPAAPKVGSDYVCDDDGADEFDREEMSCWSQMQEAAKAGLRFVAYNGPGIAYGEGAMVGFGGECVEVPTIECEPACIIEKNGEPRAEALKNARRFLELERAFRAEIGARLARLGRA